VVTAGPITFDGELLAPPSFDKRFEVIGDSISAGFGVECATNDEPFSYATENAYDSYWAIAARSLGVDVHAEAWSGIGMYRDVGGGFEQQMPLRFERTLGDDENSSWNFDQYTPHAVLVHLGTNDFAQGDPGEPFVTAYVAFVTVLRERYPDARLYFAVSPMLSGDRRTALQGYLAQLLAARNADGDTNVAIIEFATPSGWTCGHPDATTHQTMATVLEQTLAADLGW
jgi:hypothetical protein